MEIVTKLFKLVAVELCTIIRYDSVGDSIPADDIFVDELFDLRGHDGCKRFYFNPFSEVVDIHYGVLYTISPFEKSVDYVDSTDCEWPRTGHGCKLFRMGFRYWQKSLAFVTFACVLHAFCL